MRIEIMISVFLGLATYGCTTEGGEDPDDVVTTEEDPEETPEKTPEEIPEETGELPDVPEEVEGVLEDPPETTEVIDDPVVETPPPVETTSVPTIWSPNNSGAAPSPVRQTDLTIQCQQMGPGVNPGYVRYGCKAYTQDGTHYGVVKGWWQVVRVDGARAKAKDLNFREGGFDMAFDVLAPDAVAGIAVRPGPGEARPLCPTGY